MAIPEDAKYLFVESQAAFAPVFGAPNDDDVKRLYKAFVNALQSINLPGGEVNLSDILLFGDNHKAKHSGKMFNCMKTPLKSYDDGIAGGATNTVCSKDERLWTANIELQQLVKTVKRAGRAFFKDVVKETCILLLKK